MADKFAFATDRMRIASIRTPFESRQQAHRLLIFKRIRLPGGLLPTGAGAIAALGYLLTLGMEFWERADGAADRSHRKSTDNYIPQEH